MTIHKKILFVEKKKPCAVQIPIEEFECIEDIIENFGLAKLIDEAPEEKNLPLEEAKKYYESWIQQAFPQGIGLLMSPNLNSGRFIAGAAYGRGFF